MIEQNPVITAIGRFIDLAQQSGLAQQKEWAFAIEAGRGSIAQSGDKLILTDGSFVVVDKAWHGKDGAWITVHRTVEQARFSRDVELYEIARSTRFSEELQAVAATEMLIPCK